MSLSMAWVQMNPHLGDLKANLVQIRLALGHAHAKGARLIIFPELALTGYPPEDLLFRSDFIQSATRCLSLLLPDIQDSWVILGSPMAQSGHLYNAVFVLHQGEIQGVYQKQHLPNYGVFDEKRYFKPGQEAQIIEVDQTRIGFCICEDLWNPGPTTQLQQLGCQMVVAVNASPFHMGKLADREACVRQRCVENKLPIVYVNAVGAQDELVFDGNSFLINKQGERQIQCPAFEAGVALVDFDHINQAAQLKSFEPLPLNLPYPQLSPCIGKFKLGETSSSQVLPSLYQALVLGVRDYVNKSGFQSVVLGLSGGIDSALTLCIAVDALGADAVTAVMMPYKYTATMSIQDAKTQAEGLGVNFLIKPIHTLFDAFYESLNLAGATDTRLTQENIQARCRGVLLMGLSNQFGSLVLTTGNKSELAVGYCTLYGDMAGGFCVLKDVFKTWVYPLARLVNEQKGAMVIPKRVIERVPSAELSPNQTDQDNLPDYEVLDKILKAYVEQNLGVEEIIASGLDAKWVEKVIRLVDLNEHKRRQAPIGVKVSPLGFGRDRRYPLVQGFR